VRRHVFVVEFAVELWVDLGLSQLRFLEDDREGDFFVPLLFPLFGQSLNADYFGVWISLVPFANKYVVLSELIDIWRAFWSYLKVRRRNVLQFS
jgi:hypothetical protein